MTFWKTVGAVIVGNIIIGVLGWLLFVVVLASAFSGASSPSGTISVPDSIDTETSALERSLDYGGSSSDLGERAQQNLDAAMQNLEEMANESR